MFDVLVRDQNPTNWNLAVRLSNLLLVGQLMCETLKNQLTVWPLWRISWQFQDWWLFWVTVPTADLRLIVYLVRWSEYYLLVIISTEEFGWHPGFTRSLGLFALTWLDVNCLDSILFVRECTCKFCHLGIQLKTQEIHIASYANKKVLFRH